ncbi:MAG: hypothetical protein ACYC1M_09035 [Armatimonadota bacterium]
MKIQYNSKNSFLRYSNGVCYYGISETDKRDVVYSYKFGGKPTVYTQLQRQSKAKFWIMFQVWSDGTVLHVTGSDYSHKSNSADTIVYQATTPTKSIDIPRQYALGDVLLWSQAKSPYSDLVAFRNHVSQAVIMHWPSMKVVDISPKELGKFKGLHWNDNGNLLLITKSNQIYKYDKHRYNKIAELDPSLAIVSVAPSGQGVILWNLANDTTEYHDINTNRTLQICSGTGTSISYTHKGKCAIVHKYSFDKAYILDLNSIKIKNRYVSPMLWSTASDANINKQLDFVPCILWDGDSATAEISRIYIK